MDPDPGSGSWIRILLFSLLTFKMPAKNKPDPDPYLGLVDPDQGGPKPCGSGGSGSGTLTVGQRTGNRDWCKMTKQYRCDGEEKKCYYGCNEPLEQRQNSAFTVNKHTNSQHVYMPMLWIQIRICNTGIYSTIHRHETFL
jgi:hypothetical protein